MKNYKGVIILVVVSVIVLGYLFYKPAPSEIAGCTDATADNYNSLATIDDSSCTDKSLLIEILGEELDVFRNTKWDKDIYFNLRVKIESHFASRGKSESLEEDNALTDLDYNYMYVLKEATNKSLRNCFKSSSSLKSEVSSFYKKYRNKNQDIKSANSIFGERSRIKRFKKDVSSLLRREYNLKSYQDLKNKINDNLNSSFYQKNLKRCSDLSSIMPDCISDLDRFYYIDQEYKKFSVANASSLWTSGVPAHWISTFKNYKWYHTKVKNVDIDRRKRYNNIL